MYANLTITKSSGEQFAAWMVDVAPDGVATAYMDAQDGTGKYAEPNGTVVLAPPYRVEACF